MILKKHLFILLLLSSVSNFIYAQTQQKLRPVKPWQKYFNAVLFDVDTVSVEKVLLLGIDINQAVNGITPLMSLAMNITKNDAKTKNGEMLFYKKINMFNYLVKKGARLNMGYKEAMKNSIFLSKKSYDSKYKSLFMTDLNVLNDEENELFWRTFINKNKALLFKYTYKFIDKKTKNEEFGDYNVYGKFLADITNSPIVTETVDIDDKILNFFPIDFIYIGELEEYFEYPKIKKRFIELIETNNLEEFKKLYSKYKFPFASKHNPKAQYALFNNSPYRLVPSKEIVEFAINNGFDVNATYEDKYGRTKYGRLIEQIYQYKGKDYLPKEKEFESFKTIYEMCLKAGLDMNFTYDKNKQENVGLILDIIRRGNTQLYDLIPKGQLKKNSSFLNMAIYSESPEMLEKILELNYSKEELTNALFLELGDAGTKNKVIETLLKYNLDMKQTKTGNNNHRFKDMTIINYALVNNYQSSNIIEIIKLLVKHGADINQPNRINNKHISNKVGETPLFFTLDQLVFNSTKLKLIDYFLDNNAKLYAENFDGVKQDLFTVALKGKSDNLGAVIDYLLKKNIPVTDTAVNWLKYLISPGKKELRNPRPELKPYLKKLKAKKS